MSFSEILRKSALLLVDFQNDFIDPPDTLADLGIKPISGNDRITAFRNARMLLESVRDANRPVFHVRTAFRPDLADCLFSPFWIERIGSKIPFLVEGSHGASFVKEIAARPSDFIVTKKGHSAFQHTPLDRMLTEQNVSSCIVAGFSGVVGSVDDTVRQGAALGYEIVLISDASFPLDSSGSGSLRNRAIIQTTTETVDELSKVDQHAAERESGLRPALIVVDMQNDSIHREGCNERLGFSHLTDAERELIISNNQRLSNFMRQKGWPVVYVNLAHRIDLSDSASPKMVHRNKQLPSGTGRRTEGSWGAQTVAELAPQEKDYVLIKKGQSAFGFTPLHRLLRNLAINRCFVTGGAVTGCVSDTVREGAGLGYRTVVVSDATYPPRSPHLASLAGRAEIKTTDEVMRVLQSVAELYFRRMEA